MTIQVIEVAPDEIELIEVGTLITAGSVEDTLDSFTTVTEANDTDIVFVKQGSAWVKMTYANFTDGLGGDSLPSSTDGQLLVSNSGTYASVTMSGGATIDNAGAVTLSTTALNSWLSGKTTDNLTQGSTNKYYSDALVTTYIQALTPKASVVAGDKLAMMDSEASDAPKYALASALATYMQLALAATFAAASHTHTIDALTGGTNDTVLAWSSGAPTWSATPTVTSLTAPLVVLGASGELRSGSTSTYIAFNASNTEITLNAGSRVNIPGSGGNVRFGVSPVYWAHQSGSVTQRGPTPHLIFINNSSGGNGWGLQVTGNDFALSSGENYWQANITERYRFTTTGLGIGTTAPAAPLHAAKSDATTGAAVEVTRFEAQSSGTPAAGFGVDVTLYAENDSNAVEQIGAIRAAYTSPTAASERSILEWYAAKTSTITKIMSAGYNASGNAVHGFYEAAPVEKPAITGSRGGNAALASLLTALASQGLITDSSTA